MSFELDITCSSHLNKFPINLSGDFIGELDAGEVLGRQVGRVSVLVDSADQEHVTEIESVYPSIEIRRCVYNLGWGLGRCRC